MPISQHRLRSLTRTIHLVAALVAVVAVYLPVWSADTARLVLAAVVLPLLALSGLVLWQQARVRRILRSRRVTGSRA